MFQQTPLFSKTGSYVWPSWAGAAIWVTTPALLYAYFPNIRDRRIAIAGAFALAASILLILTRSLARVYWPGLGWADLSLSDDYFLLPFWGLAVITLLAFARRRDGATFAACSLSAAVATVAFFVSRILAGEFWSSLGWHDLHGLYLLLFWWLAALAIALAVRDRDKLALAAGRDPAGGVFLFMFAATGWTQFGYRTPPTSTRSLPARREDRGDRMRWDMRVDPPGRSGQPLGRPLDMPVRPAQMGLGLPSSATDAWTWVGTARSTPNSVPASTTNRDAQRLSHAAPLLPVGT
jgi:hypothetical protein